MACNSKIGFLEKRQFILSEESYNYKVVFFQNELLRIYNILDSVNSHNLKQKIKFIIFLRDYRENTKTNFDIEPFKGNIAKHYLKCRDYRKRLKAQKELKNRMEKYYGEYNKKN